MTYLSIFGNRWCTGNLTFRRSAIGDGRSEALRASGSRTVLRTGLDARLNFVPMLLDVVTSSWYHGLQLLSRWRGKQCTVTLNEISSYFRTIRKNHTWFVRSLMLIKWWIHGCKLSSTRQWRYIINVYYVVFILIDLFINHLPTPVVRSRWWRIRKSFLARAMARSLSYDKIELKI